MRTFLTVSVAVLLSASLALAANTVRGEYIEARTADVFTGACFANSEAGAVGELAVLGWKIDKGAWDGVQLDGLTVVGVVKANSTLGDIHSDTYPVKAVLVVDEKASPEQRLALQGFAKRMGGDLLADVVRVEYQPMTFEVEDNNVHSATAMLKAGNLATITTRAISKNDHICSNEEVWYLPLTKVQHAMPAYAVSHKFEGDGLGTKWSSPDKRSAFVANFQYQD
ncbi:MAG: DUF1326 domain-containing protein [Acidimicrobiia bacterium]|nr:DUF1326 domain-containing protein [Acidimicrobiia bacterium]